MKARDLRLWQSPKALDFNTGWKSPAPKRPPVSQLHPAQWNSVRRGRTHTQNRMALYTCKKPWWLKTDHGESFMMPCRWCGSCVGNRKNDITGRCLAQAATSYDVWVTTLTYDDAKRKPGEIDGAGFRCVEHVQAFIHHLRQQARRATGKDPDLKYFGVYEEGEKNGRGHWHVILFWGGKVPESVVQLGSLSQTAHEGVQATWMPKVEYHTCSKDQFLKRRDNPKIVCLAGGKKHQQTWDAWRHGIVTVHSLYRGRHAQPNKAHNAVQYCVKYCLKQRQRYLMSQNMGMQFFMAKIGHIINSGLQLHDLTYTFQDQMKLPQYGPRLRQKRSLEAGGDFIAKDRQRVYQLQGVMRSRAVVYAIRLHRKNVKNRYRERMRRTGETVDQLRRKIRSDMRIQKVGDEACIWLADKLRYSAQKDSPNLDRLEAKAIADRELADELANIGYQHSREAMTKNRIDYDHPDFRKPQKKGPAMLARERVLTRKPKAAKRPKNSHRGFD